MTAEGRGDFEKLRGDIISHAARMEPKLQRSAYLRYIAIATHRVANSLDVAARDETDRLLRNMHLATFNNLDQLGKLGLNECLFGLAVVASLGNVYETYGRHWMRGLCAPCQSIVDEARKSEPNLSTIGNAIIDIFAVTTTVESEPKEPGHYLHSAWKHAQEMKIMSSKNKALRELAEATFVVEMDGAKKPKEK